MRIGCNIDTFLGTRDQPVPDARSAARAIDSIIEEGILAERAGFHSVRVPDRHGRTDCAFPGALQLLTLLARETHRVALGAFALVNTLYSPMLIAEQSSIIDNLSRGRLFMTWARGKDYWEYFGIPKERLLGRFLENVEIIERALETRPFSFHGDFYDVDEALLTPGPYQHPRFPFWGGGMSRPATKRAATIAEAWACDDFPIDFSTWDEHASAYRDLARQAGKDPFIVLSRNAWVADSFEEAVEQFGSHYVNQMREVAKRGRLDAYPEFNSPEKVNIERLADQLVIGTPQQCIERIEFYEKELGVNYLTMRFRLPTGTSFAAVRDQIVRFGEEVVSYFHQKDPATVHPAIPAGARW